MMINEHISFQSSLSLEEFTKRLGKNMSLKRFQFDYENENNWSWTYDESNIEINISKPFEDGKLQEWDDSTPIGCNFSLSLLLKSEPESVEKNDLVIKKVISEYVVNIEKIIGQKAFYHRGNFLNKFEAENNVEEK